MGRKYGVTKGGIVCVVAAAGLSGLISTAAAQADLNIETRIEAATPRFPERIPSTAGEVRVERKVERRLRPPEELEPLIARELARNPQFRTLSATPRTLSTMERQSVIKALGPRAYRSFVTIKRVVTSRKYVAEVSLTLGPTFDTNVPKSNLNPESDFSGTLAPAGRLTVPIGDQADQLVIAAGTSTVRFSHLTAQDFDVVLASAAYDWIKLISDPRYATPGTTRREVLQFAIGSQTAFEPTFRDEKIYFVTPNVSMNWLNLPISSDICSAGAKSEAFCHYVDISIRLAHAFSDVPAAQNTSVSLSGRLGWRFPKQALSATFGGSLTGKTYPDFPRGREDIVLVIGPRFDKVLSDYVTANIGMTYTRQFSSVAASEYDAFAIAAQLVLSNKWQWDRP
jgi:hypothetical protein